MDFADDIAFISNSLLATQDMTCKLQDNAAKVGLRISADKTKAMAVVNTQAPSLRVENRDIETMEHFQCLGSNISREDDTDYDIYTPIGKAFSVPYTDVFVQCGDQKVSVEALRCACIHQLSFRLLSAPVKCGERPIGHIECSVYLIEDVCVTYWECHGRIT